MTTTRTVRNEISTFVPTEVLTREWVRIGKLLNKLRPLLGEYGELSPAWARGTFNYEWKRQEKIGKELTRREYEKAHEEGRL